jgi:hypothetical protein
MKRTILSILLICAVGAVVVFLKRPTPLVSGGAVTPTPVAYNNLIVLENPLPGATISSPLTVRGKARGPWYFEASFPVVLTDWDGRIIAQAPAQAKGDWMTNDWVPFEAVLTFDADTKVSSRSALILKKDNPSGLPEHDDALEITVFFAP